jgi:uncharacterized protein YqeY
MSLLERLNDDLKQAMRNKDKEKLSVIRMLKASLQNETIKLGRPDLTEDEELTILSREVKQRKDSLREFENADRQDLADKIHSELAIIDEYLPQQLTEEELSLLVKKAVEQTNSSSKADMGKVMTVLIPQTKGKADGAIVSKLVQQHLS